MEPAEPVKQCQTCKKDIEEGDFLEIDLGAFHAECFACVDCKTNLAGESFIPVDNHIFCEKCYAEKKAPKCNGCTKPIQTTTFLKIGDQTFHRDCFVCVNCKALFKTMTYFKSAEGMLCEGCFKGALKKCTLCKEPIKDKIFTAFDKYWHPACFRCGVCHKAFDSLSYVPFRGKAYHLDCYQKSMLKMCKICGKSCGEDYFETKEGDAIHEGPCMEKYKAEQDKLKNMADAIHQKWEERMRSELTFVPKAEEQKVQDEIKGTEARNSIDQKFYPYDKLVKMPFPADVDVTKRETYLTDEEFERKIGMPKDSFYNLKEWRQKQIKQKVGLF